MFANNIDSSQCMKERFPWLCITIDN